MCIKEISSFLPLHSQQLSDIFLIVRVAEGLCIKEHLIRAVTQQVFVNMSKLAGHRPTPIFGEDLLGQDHEPFSL